MRPTTHLTTFLLTATLGLALGCEGESPADDAPAPTPGATTSADDAGGAADDAGADAGADATIVTAAAAPDDALAGAGTEAADTVADAGRAESPVTSPASDPDRPLSRDELPTIDFPLLAETRSDNLIDMTLRFPDTLRDLDGRQVRMVGFMAPFDDLTDMRRCMIMPTYVGCNFCEPPRINQVVFVTQDEDAAGPRPFVEEASHITGTLRLKMPDSTHEGQKHGFLYSIEGAVITAYGGDAPERLAVHGTTPHDAASTRLEPVPGTELVAQVADLIGWEPLRPINFERLPAESFVEVVRTSVERSFPEPTHVDRAHAFRLLGLLPEDSAGAEWLDMLTEDELALRVAVADETGERITVLGSMPSDDPYSRLELVGVIAEAITRQHDVEHGRTLAAGGGAAAGALSDDARRAYHALRMGIRSSALLRYARTNGVATGARPPIRFVHETRVRRRGQLELRLALESTAFGIWLELPGAVGVFFVDSIIGDTTPLAELEPILADPPTTTMEFFRPQWYHDDTKWRPDPVPSDFADGMLDTAPILTDVLGIGGLVPMFAQWYPISVAKTLADGWAGDRWALWHFEDGSSAVVMETRWQDEAAAVRFRKAIPQHPQWHVFPHEPGNPRVRLIRADSDASLRRFDLGTEQADD